MKSRCHVDVLIINPLSHTLAHYQAELLEILASSDIKSVQVAQSITGEGITGSFARLNVAVRTILQRAKLGLSTTGRDIIVAWPLFGYLEPLTLIFFARRNTVYIILHDPTPLRHSYGQSVVARRLFKAVANRLDMKVLYHTKQAQVVGAEQCGVIGEVVPHPLQLSAAVVPDSPDRKARPVVRVLGQYKETRSIRALIEISNLVDSSVTLEIHGRGWPAVPGWKVSDRFVPEVEFENLVATSDCVVIPYDSFFQSGVAVRCFEVGVRLVGPAHEHIMQLYGESWPGIVRDDSDWYDALARAMATSSAEMQSRHLHVVQNIRDAWKELLLPH